MRVQGLMVAMPSPALALALLLLLPGWGFAFRITSSLAELNFLLEESLEVECSYSPEDTELVSVEQIRVAKQDGRRGWKVMATRYASGFSAVQSDQAFQVSGQVGPEASATYLRLVWPLASEAEIGSYRCDVVGMDVSNEFVVEKTNVVSVHEHNVTSADLVLVWQRQLDSLQLEFDQYKKEAGRLIASLMEEVQELQNRTSDSQAGNQTGDDNAGSGLDIDQLREDIQETVLTAVSLQVESTTCSRVSRCLSDLPQERGAPGDIKLLAPAVTTPAAVTTTTETVLPWPSGRYGLLMPEAGCPESDHSPVWLTGYIGYHTESVDENHDKSSASIHMKKPIFRTFPNRWGETHITYMNFCLNGNSNHPDSQTQTWPAGSYCIHRDGGRCPPDFGSGYLDIDEEREDRSGEDYGELPDMFYFCCRSDGDASLPVRLPREVPFYLYRFGGQCQAVRGMTVTEESITLDTENENNEDSYENDFHPDGRLHDVRIELCYYS